MLVDCEHGALADDAMHVSVKAIAAAGSSPIVRIPGPEPWMIKRALDSGAHGIMVPMVETASQAESVAKASRYPYALSGYPEGIRGTGGLFASAAWGMGNDYAEYTKLVNRQLVVIVQIETLNGVLNCEEIASVNGIDALFVGPNDLAASMGFLGEDHSQVHEVQEATMRVLKAAKSANKFAGYFCLSADAAASQIRRGWDFVNCGADIVAIISWMSNEMTALRNKITTKTKENGQTNGSNGMNGYC